MKEVAVKLLEGLEENKAKYEELYNTDDYFRVYIDILKSSLECMINGSNEYPYDEVIYDYDTYITYLRDLTISKDKEGFWSYVSEVKPLVIETSDDFTYFVVRNNNRVNKYDAKTKVLRK